MEPAVMKITDQESLKHNSDISRIGRGENVLQRSLMAPSCQPLPTPCHCSDLHHGPLCLRKVDAAEGTQVPRDAGIQVKSDSKRLTASHGLREKAATASSTGPRDPSAGTGRGDHSRSRLLVRERRV